MSGIFVFLLIVAAVILYFVSIFNKLVRLKNAVANQFAQIDVQLKRRYDLIPNLVETAKGSMKHERETLEAVIKARNSAFAAFEKVNHDPTKPGAISELVGAENILTQTLSRFVALTENYPDLKANANMSQLMEELTSTENKVSFARQAYNDAVMEYNTNREVFPNSLLAGGFSPGTLYQIENVQQRETPQVKF